MSVSEDLETRLRSLSIDRGSDKAPAHREPALSTVPNQPKATPPPPHLAACRGAAAAWGGRCCGADLCIS